MRDEARSRRHGSALRRIFPRDVRATCLRAAPEPPRRRAKGLRGRAESRAACRGHAWRWTPAHRRRSRNRQDAHARLSRRAPDRAGCSPRPDPPPDVHPPRRAGDARARGAARGSAQRASSWRHIPRDRAPTAARLWVRRRAGQGLHDHGSRRRGRPHAALARSARIRAEEIALSQEGDAALRLFAARQHRHRHRRHHRRRVPSVPRLSRGSHADLRRLHQSQGRAQSRRLRRPAAVLGGHAGERHRSSRKRVAGLYDHVLVDEYQDTNVLQARILRGMCREHRNITVVGDDAQSIYSFRGANFRNILDFPEAVRGRPRS